MTIEERKERFFKFKGCVGVACAECPYNYTTSGQYCREAIHEDAVELLKHETLKREAAEEVARTLKSMDDAATIAEAIKPHKYETPLTGEDRERIKELIRVKTEVPDLSAHFIQEINELCAELNGLAATIGKLEQLVKGTDPVKKELTDDELIEAMTVSVADICTEAADVINYLWVTGQIDNGYHAEIEGIRNEKLARWANRLNGVSDE